MLELILKKVMFETYEQAHRLISDVPDVALECHGHGRFTIWIWNRGFFFEPEAS